MMKNFLFLLLIISFVLAGCSEQKKLVFNGESDNWSVNYIAQVHSSDSEEVDYTIRYIGEEPAPKTIDYQIGDDLVKGQSLNDKNNSVKKDGESCSGCAVTLEGDEIKMTIKWNENAETLTLTSD